MPKSGALFRYALKSAGAWVAAVWLALAAGIVRAQDTGVTKPFRDLIDANCSKCHNSTDWAGGLAYDTMDLSQVGDDPQIWEKVITKLSGRLMPPAGEKQPSQ